MDPRVCGKLLTLHRRGNGVDVEALNDQFPLWQITRKSPQDGISRVEKVVAVDRKVFSWLPLMFLGYKSIYRRKKYVGGATRGPRGWGHAYPLGAPSYLVASLLHL